MINKIEVTKELISAKTAELLAKYMAEEITFQNYKENLYPAGKVVVAGDSWYEISEDLAACFESDEIDTSNTHWDVMKVVQTAGMMRIKFTFPLTSKGREKLQRRLRNGEATALVTEEVELHNQQVEEQELHYLLDMQAEIEAKKQEQLAMQELLSQEEEVNKRLAEIQKAKEEEALTNSQPLVSIR